MVQSECCVADGEQAACGVCMCACVCVLRVGLLLSLLSSLQRGRRVRAHVRCACALSPGGPFLAVKQARRVGAPSVLIQRARKYVRGGRLGWGGDRGRRRRETMMGWTEAERICFPREYKSCECVWEKERGGGGGGALSPVCLSLVLAPNRRLRVFPWRFLAPCRRRRWRHVSSACVAWWFPGQGGGGCFVWVDWCVVSGSRACGKEGFGVCISGFEGLPEGRAEISRWGARPRIIDLEEGAMLGSE
jgi:hypothetical protein